MAKDGFLSVLKTVLLGTLVALLIKLLRLTVRWQYVGFPERPSKPEVSPVVVAFWHCRLLLMADVYWKARRRRSRGVFMLISRHGDGRLISFAVRILGIYSVAGSSSRGGLAALIQLSRKIEDGYDVGFTPDGPRGPRHECKAGVVAVAQRSGIPILPMSYSTEKRWQLSSWDGMIVPKPFSRGVMILGEPLVILPDEDQERARVRVQEALNDINERADRYWDAA